MKKVANRQLQPANAELTDFVKFGADENFLQNSLACATSNLGGKAKVIFVSDEKIWANSLRFFPKNFLKNFDKILLLKNPKADEKNLKKVLLSAKKSDFIIALGSGVINDLCKFLAAQKKISYAIFASAPSMNGYLSRNASITISGHKKTLPATLPKMVFCDFRILRSAPLNLVKAGIGDSLCFYSCWFDWYLSYKILGTKFDEKPFEILAPKMDFLLKNFSKFSLRDEKFLQLLTEILMLSGLGMTMAGGSYPASQSEHLIAHAIEMKYPKIAEKKLHGEMIAVSVLTSAKLQKKILQMRQEPLLSADLKLGDLQKFFGKKIAKQCEQEFNQKSLLVANAALNKASLQKDWSKIREKLQKIYLDEAQLKKVFSHFKIKTSSKSLGLSSQQYQACVAYSKFIRNRFTCLDLVA